MQRIARMKTNPDTEQRGRHDPVSLKTGAEDGIGVFQLSNRRYIGCKQKLLDWIFGHVEKFAPDAKSFFDVFSGTGVVAERALSCGRFERVVLNDFLDSNRIVYEGFFASGAADAGKLENIAAEYDRIDPDKIEGNWFSENYGGKYFEVSLARTIGFIREDIERRANDLSRKEYCVLLASLLYSIDSHANTCGHFDAYIKKPIPRRDFRFGLIAWKSCDTAEIHQRDANELVREVSADVAYVDPPYNSRQYSRFYHVYETLVEWKKPELSGVARKPPPKHMSAYCRNSAPEAFADLVRGLKSKYVFVSYNNTYDSKSSSSANKITLEQIRTVLEREGETRMFSIGHNAFTTGKTEFENHCECLFAMVRRENAGKRARAGTGFLRSPFFYVGDKFKLLPAILPRFPETINRFVEPFVGGGSVFLNVAAKRFLLNDVDANLIALHRHLLDQAAREDDWLRGLETAIRRFGLSRSFREDVVPPELKRQYPKTYFAKFNKAGFEALRDAYNAGDRTGKEALDDLFLLLVYGFNRMLRFNGKGNFNLPVGNVDFNANVENALHGYFDRVRGRDIRFSSLDFREFLTRTDPTPDDFVYLDPPYLIAESEYNKIWKPEDDRDLMRLVDDLHARGVRFALSDVTHYRGRTNGPLLEWIGKYHVVDVKSNYINYHDNAEKSIREVLVTNWGK